jgi:hypothetical protein
VTAYLHQILAVDNGIEADTQKTLDQVRHVMAVGGKQDPLTGLRRTHKSRNTDKWPDLPEESRLVQVTVPDLLTQVRKAMIALFDVKYTREAGNAGAAADVILDGDSEPLLTAVPVGYLMFLENKILSFITTVIDKIPVRDPAEEWHGQATDPNLPRGVWASAPRETPSTVRDRLVQVVAEPQVIDGKAFDGQYIPYEADVNTGTRTLVSYSGQLSVQDVQDMRERAVAVLTAVRFARQKANMTEAEPRHAGAAVFGHILGNLVA